MNSELPLTRRDVVAIVIYATLAYNVLSALLYCLSQLVFPTIPWLVFSGSSGNIWWYAVSLGINFVFALAFWPFVSLISSGLTGRKASQAVVRRNLFSLILPCVGVMLFIQSFPNFARTAYNYLALSSSVGSINSMHSIRAIYLREILSSVICVSVGFALAFFPAIFESLRANVRGEESAA